MFRPQKRLFIPPGALKTCTNVLGVTAPRAAQATGPPRAGLVAAGAIPKNLRTARAARRLFQCADERGNETGFGRHEIASLNSWGRRARACPRLVLGTTEGRPGRTLAGPPPRSAPPRRGIAAARSGRAGTATSLVGAVGRGVWHHSRPPSGAFGLARATRTLGRRWDEVKRPPARKGLPPGARHGAGLPPVDARRRRRPHRRTALREAARAGKPVLV
jgi:hypothetical protein